MDSNDMMQVLEQFTKHLQVPESNWEKHEGPDELIASAILEKEPLLKTARKTDNEEYVRGIKQDQKRPSVMFHPKYVQKKGVNELKELMEPDLPKNNVIQLERETTRIIKGRLKGKDVGKPIIPCSFGKFKYRGICDATCDINMISYEMYDEIRYTL